MATHGTAGCESSIIAKRGEAVLIVRRFGPALEHSIAVLLEFIPRPKDRHARVQGELTPQEDKVLHWVTAGKSNGEIAQILGLAASTVGKHLEHIFSKLHVENRTAAASYYAPQKGWGTSSVTSLPTTFEKLGSITTEMKVERASLFDRSVVKGEARQR